MFSKLITIVVLLLSLGGISLFGATTYRYYQAIHSDDPITPYLSVESGKATIARGDTAIDLIAPESYDIREGDVIANATGAQSVIFWPDHSTTRLSGGSQISIDRMNIASDYSQVELIVSIKSGKAWSNIVRTLYPDSRVEFRLPKTGTIAGVRGTVFEIDADNDIVNAIKHKVTLSGEIGGIVTLLPGQGANSKFLKKITHSGSNNDWRILNQSFDVKQNTYRSSQIQESYNILAGSNEGFPFDDSIRTILSKIDVFSDITLLEAVRSKDLMALKDVPEESLMKLYQRFQYKDFIQERDLIRGALLRASGSYIDTDAFQKTLIQGALYDISDFSGIILEETMSAIQESKELQNEMKEMQFEIEQEMKVMEQELQVEMKEMQIGIENEMKEMQTGLQSDMEDMTREIGGVLQEQENEMKEMQTEIGIQAKDLELEIGGDIKDLQIDIEKDLDLR